MGLEGDTLTDSLAPTSPHTHLEMLPDKRSMQHNKLYSLATNRSPVGPMTGVLPTPASWEVKPGRGLGAAAVPGPSRVVRPVCRGSHPNWEHAAATGAAAPAWATQQPMDAAAAVATATTTRAHCGAA